MSMMELITKISLCMIAAAILGFLVGWLFSALFKNEKIEKKYDALYDEFEVKESEIKQLHQDLSLIQNDLSECEKKLNECEKDRLNAQMEQDSGERYLRQIKELESENRMLVSQIKEQKICEDENELLKDEIRVLEDEKQKLLDQLDAYKEYEHNYKALIVEIESLKSEKEKLQKLAQEKDTLSKEEYENILKDVLTLKSEVTNMKKRKEDLERKLSQLRSELEKKNKTIKELQEPKEEPLKDIYRILPQERESSNEESDIDDQVCKEGKQDEEIKIKKLSELIKETLKDIKKT